MVGKQGMNTADVGRRNRNLVVMELMKQPTHFSDLKRKLKFSATTLTGHLEKLLEEGVVKRQVQGRKVVFVVVEEKKIQTMLEMRTECRNELALLAFDYGICLTNEARSKLREALDVLDDSIVNRKQDVDVAGKMLGISESDLDKTFVGKLKLQETKRRSGK